jgi:hypothetical protein
MDFSFIRISSSFYFLTFFLQKENISSETAAILAVLCSWIHCGEGDKLTKHFFRGNLHVFVLSLQGIREKKRFIMNNIKKYIKRNWRNAVLPDLEQFIRNWKLATSFVVSSLCTFFFNFVCSVYSLLNSSSSVNTQINIVYSHPLSSFTYISCVVSKREKCRGDFILLYTLFSN